MDMDRKYHRIQKVSWDRYWHAVYYTKDNSGKKVETWDRVSQAQALKISKKLVYTPSLATVNDGQV